MARFDRQRKAYLAIAFLVLFVAWPSGSSADPLRVWTHPLGAMINLEGPTTVRGTTPFPLYPDQEGLYHVRVDLRGHETAFGAMTLRARGDVLRLDDETHDFRGERVFSSLILPGLGQIREARVTEGVLWSTLSLGSTVSVLFFQQHYQEAHDDFEAKQALLGQTRESGDAYLGLLHETFRAETLARGRLRERNAAFIAVGGYWLVNLIDAAFFHSGFHAREASDGVLQIDLVRKNRARRAIRSALYPGLGQSYRGQRLRGVLYAAAATAAGAATLDAHLGYRRELDRIDALGRERDALAGGGAAEADLSAIVTAEQQAAVARSEDLKDRRNYAAMLAGAIYIGSLVDAFFGETDEEVAPQIPDTELSFLSPPGHDGAAGIGVRIRF